MGKLFWQINTSLDGYMEEPGGDLKRTAEIDDDKYKRYASEMLKTIDAFIIGRKTYDVFVGYWPTAEGEDAEILNKLPKIVVSRTLIETCWNNSRLANEDLAGAIKNLKDGSDRDIALFGSANLAATMIELELVDEYRIFVTPFILGKGTKTFDLIKGTVGLKLTSAEPWPSGTVALIYSI